MGDKTLRTLGIIFLVLTGLNILAYAVLGMNTRLKQEQQPPRQPPPEFNI